MTILGTLTALSVTAQPQANPDTENWLFSPGILGTVLLTAIVFLIALMIVYFRLSGYLDKMNQKTELKKKLAFSEELIGLDEAEIDAILEKRKTALAYKLSGNELGSDTLAEDKKGVVAHVTNEPYNPVVDEKKKDKAKL